MHTELKITWLLCCQFSEIKDEISSRVQYSKLSHCAFTPKWSNGIKYTPPSLSCLVKIYDFPVRALQRKWNHWHNLVSLNWIQQCFKLCFCFSLLFCMTWKFSFLICHLRGREEKKRLLKHWAYFHDHNRHIQLDLRCPSFLYILYCQGSLPSPSLTFSEKAIKKQLVSFSLSMERGIYEQ